MITIDPRFDHVVFADALNLSRAAVDYAPAQSRSSGETSTEIDDISFQQWLLERAGISPALYRPETLARRLPACLRAIGANSPAQARSFIERNQSLLHQAISALLIGVSSFFRDPGIFAAIEETILPEICARRSPRIWSIGCADGCELYSIAMLLAKRGVLDGAQLLGTDCRQTAIHTARVGRYDTAQTERDIPQDLFTKYFPGRHSAQESSIAPAIANHTRWRHADVLAVQEPGPWDLILCRNMAMYMRGEVVSKLWMILEKSLRPGGYLVLGKAERPHGAAWLSFVSPCIYRRDKG